MTRQSSLCSLFEAFSWVVFCRVYQLNAWNRLIDISRRQNTTNYWATQGSPVQKLLKGRCQKLYSQGTFTITYDFIGFNMLPWGCVTYTYGAILIGFNGKCIMLHNISLRCCWPSILCCSQAKYKPLCVFKDRRRLSSQGSLL